MESILDAACALFAEHGYDCTPITEIAHRARVATGTIIYHFKRKELLLAELALRHLRSLYAHCQMQAARGTTGMDGVLFFVSAFHAYLKNHPTECAAYLKNIPGERLKSAPDAAPDIAAAERSLALLLQCLLLSGQNDGSIQVNDVASAARNIQAVLLGGAYTILFHHGDPEALAGAAVQYARLMLTDSAPTGADSK